MNWSISKFTGNLPVTLSTTNNVTTVSQMGTPAAGTYNLPAHSNGFRACLKDGRTTLDEQCHGQGAERQYVYRDWLRQCEHCWHRHEHAGTAASVHPVITFAQGTILDQSSFTFTMYYESVTFLWDGSKWYAI